MRLNSKQLFLVLCDYVAAAQTLAENTRKNEPEDQKARQIVNKTFPLLMEQCTPQNKQICHQKLREENGYSAAFLELIEELGFQKMD